MKTENVSTLKINKLTQAQYDRELAAGNIDENALYLTPEEAITPEFIGAAAASHTHDITDVGALDLMLEDITVDLSNHTHNVLNNKYYSDVTGTVGLYAAAKDRFYLAPPYDANYEINLGKSDRPINWIYAKGNIITERAVAAGARVYVGNECSFRGANAGVSPNDVQVDTSQAIGFVNANNDVILGSHDNTGKTMVRCPSGKDLFLQTNGVTTTTNSDGCIQFTYISENYYFRPSLTDVTRLGSASYKWGQIYSSKETISTSDRNLKKNIQDLDDRYIELFDLIRPVSYQLLKGDRLHTGFIAQEVEDAMEKVGLSAEELGFFCKDIKVVADDENETDVPVLDEEGNPVYIYSLRYSEYIAIMAEKVRRQDKKIKELESKIVSYEERLTALENKL